MPTTPMDIISAPPTTQMLSISDAQPGTAVPLTKALATFTRMMMLIMRNAIPTRMIIYIGLTEKDVIPSMAKARIFFKFYCC